MLCFTFHYSFFTIHCLDTEGDAENPAFSFMERALEKRVGKSFKFDLNEKDAFGKIQ